MNIFIKVIIIYFLTTMPSLAYIDPGTGGFILQVLVGFLASVGIFFSRIRNAIKNILLKIFTKNKKKK